MNIKKYQALVRAIELGSLSKASEELGCTQSGLSHMMQSLEEEIGFPLIERTSTGIVPNNEGAVLLPMIRQLLADYEVIGQTIAQIQGADTGCMRIAASPSVATCWLPEIVGAFQTDFPQVDIQIIEGDNAAIEAMMEKREADFCLYAQTGQHRFEWTPLWEDALLAVVPQNHPLAAKESISLAELSRERLIVSAGGYDYQSHCMLPSGKISLTACSKHTVLAMVGQGLGVSILPALMVADHQTQVVARALEPSKSRTIGMGVPQKKTASPIVRNFMQYVEAFIQKKT